MAPSATPISPSIKDFVPPKKDSLPLPAPALARLSNSGVDLSSGYPYRPSIPLYLDDVYKIRSEPRDYVDAGVRADKSKKHLFAAATKVTDLTANIGTEIEGLQLKDLTDVQKDELALLIAERSVVFLRDQELSPQKQKELGEYFGEVEVHVSLSTLPNHKCTRPSLTTCYSPKSLKSPASPAYPLSGPTSGPRTGPRPSASRAAPLDGTATSCTSCSRRE